MRLAALLLSLRSVVPQTPREFLQRTNPALLSTATPWIPPSTGPCDMYRIRRHAPAFLTAELDANRDGHKLGAPARDHDLNRDTSCRTDSDCAANVDIAR